MTTVVGIKFKKSAKMYYFAPGDIPCALGDQVVVETARGTEIGEVAMAPMALDDDKVVTPLKNVVRLVTARDEQLQVRQKEQEAQAFELFSKKIAEYKLDMKPVEVEYSFDGSKITFFFTSDGRVDFRDLVKELAHQFRARIELRQIGVRDEAKMLGGLGKCGCPICCRQFLPNFTPVSIKMAKEQNVSLNPNKISGLCGRLMCCLNFEQSYYEQMRKLMPRIGTQVHTERGYGIVSENNYLMEMVKVRVQRDDGVMETMDIPLAEIQLATGAPPIVPVKPVEQAPQASGRTFPPRPPRPRPQRPDGPPRGEQPPRPQPVPPPSPAVTTAEASTAAGGDAPPKRSSRRRRRRPANKPQA